MLTAVSLMPCKIRTGRSNSEHSPSLIAASFTSSIRSSTASPTASTCHNRFVLSMRPSQRRCERAEAMAGSHCIPATNRLLGAPCHQTQAVNKDASMPFLPEQVSYGSTRHASSRLICCDLRFQAAKALQCQVGNRPSHAIHIHTSSTSLSLLTPGERLNTTVPANFLRKCTRSSCQGTHSVVGQDTKMLGAGRKAAPPERTTLLSQQPNGGRLGSLGCMNTTSIVMKLTTNVMVQAATE